MDDLRIAVVGIGATGTVLAAALLHQYPETILVSPRQELGEHLLKNGLRVSGALNYQLPVHRFSTSIEKCAQDKPNLIFIATKTFHLPRLLQEMKGVFAEGTKIVSTHNGLGTEDVIAEAFGKNAALRMSLNYGVSLKGPGEAEVAFFNRPNPLGALTPENQAIGAKIADLLTAGGLDTEFVEDIKLHVWKKMVMKCTMASICAVTDMTIKDALRLPPTRAIADACFAEVLAVARAKGYDLGADYLNQALAYLEKVGIHKDSMCVDIANKTRTEIDFLGGKVVEYGRETGVPTPCYATMANLVRTMEEKYHAR